MIFKRLLRPRGSFAIVVALAAAVLGVPRDAEAQAGEPPRVFLDCQGPGCDYNYFRTEIDWVTWVRDQNDANVHIIVTVQQTGAGGREYVMDFMGRPPYGSYRSESRYQTLPTDTQREQLDGVTLMLGLGIAHFATESGFRDLVSLSGLAPANEVDRVRSADEVNDPWNLWVFRVSANGNYNGQSSRNDWRLQAGFNASRVSPTWKQSYNGNFNRRHQRIEFTTREPFVDNRYDWGFSWRVSYALAEHFSIGGSGNAGRNTTNNQDVWGQVNPAIEYSYFPYAEATRRSLTAFYEIGPVYRHYFERTLYGELQELRVEQALNISFSQRQAWGSANVSVRGSAYLHDVHVNNLRFNGNLNFRIVRGLDLNVGGSASRVRDQLYLAGGDLTDEERLLRLQQEQTDFTVQLSFGLSYQFGSIFNNVVNNRF